MANFDTISQTLGPELEEIARLNKGQIPRATFERLVSEHFGCNERTIRSYTQTFKTFGILRQLNKSGYQFKPWVPTNEDDEREPLHQVVNA